MAYELERVSNVSTACTAVFLLYLPVNIWQLFKSSTPPSSGSKSFINAALRFLLSCIQLFCLTRYMLSSRLYEVAFAASLIASFTAALGLTVLVILEQQRAHGPSDLVTVYLIASILCDVVLLSLIYGGAANFEILLPLQLRCLTHFMILVSENCSSRSTYDTLRDSKSPEELHGVLSRVFFTWINPILLQGYRNILIDQDLPCLSEDMKPEFTRKEILLAWSKRVKPESKRTLPLALLKCVKKPFLAAIIPRLFLIAFRYSQPALIKQSIRYVTLPATAMEKSHGDWLIISAIGVYLGLAVSTSTYNNRLNRLKLVTRSALVGLIHNKTMRSPSVSYDSGESTTLMSTDADSLDGVAGMIHETWAQVVEVFIGIYLLSVEVGWIWPLPLTLIFICSHVSRYVAKHLGPLQKAWNKATQNRLAATSSMLSTMKIIKMLGFQHSITNRIEELRKYELLEASKLRWIQVYYNASANALGMFSPAITIVVFAVISRARGRSLDTETAFTTIAILGMITHPANMVMTIVPRAVASFAGFERIQTFLLRPSVSDQRSLIPSKKVLSSSSKVMTTWSTNIHPAIQIQQLRLGNEQVILQNIDIEVHQGSIAILSGPTGSGKSTLLRAVLGEFPLSEGSIGVSTQRIAYCSQKPWLPSGSIREVIQNSTHLNTDDWYNKVIDVCCLNHDIDSLSDGDKSQIGSSGLNLSGGQRQRVALARALFARCDIILLDDCLSGLDGETENKIFGHLFGRSGIFRQLNTTVVLVSNSTQYFQAADQIVILGDHGIKEKGSWQEMKVKAAKIAKFTTGHATQNDHVSSAELSKLFAQARAKEEAKVDLSRQTGDLSLYAYYLRHIKLTNTLLLITFCAICSLFMVIPQYWLQLWTDSSDGDSLFWIYGFMLLAVIAWLATNGIMWSVMIRVSPESGLRLHHRLLQIITSAPLSYFSKTENGSILNRFSQDIQLIDKQLPIAFQNLIVQIFKLLMQATLLIVAQKWLALSLPACLIVVYVVQKVYLMTSRQLRFLELESRAAVFSSFLETVEGIETIRAFGWTRKVIQRNILSVENSQRPEFLLFCLQRWLNIVLDLLAGTIATSVVVIAVLFREKINGGQVGIALNIMLVANTTLLKLVENWTILEVSLGAVSRLKSLDQLTLPNRERDGSFEPAQNWPSKGLIEFKDITASYHADSIALRSLSLKIIAGQKITICGRTGSGKSTMLLTLLRLLELQSGTIELDGVDISQVRLDLLRRQCFVTVSQDTLLLSNETLRFNLDPDGNLQDNIIIDALVRTGLWHKFAENGIGKKYVGYGTVDNADSGKHPVLDEKVSEFQELSVGQAQLFGICRALIKVTALRSAGVMPVVLLDEITSSLDPATESTIFSVVEEEFSGRGHTVISIAHRLGDLVKHTKSGRDVVVVLRDGRLQEVITDLTQLGVEDLEEDE